MPTPDRDGSPYPSEGAASAAAYAVALEGVEDLLAGIEVRLLGAGARYTPMEVWAQADVPEELARNLWLAMGFPHVPDDEAVFTDTDLAALQQADRLLAVGAFDPGVLRQQTRIMSQAVSTIATAHAEALADSRERDVLLAEGSPDDPLRILTDLLGYLYRRHLLAAVERLVRTPERASALAPVGVVGFADLTNFTATSAAATEQELTGLVDGFAGLAADAVAAAGGRVVKLIGDEVMFRVEDPVAAAEVALALVEVVDGPEDLPPVHAGLALGTLLSHHGDLFGSTVNLASRLSDVARPGSVLVNDDLAVALAGDDRYHLRRTHLRLKGIGAVTAHALRRGKAPTAVP
jgi:adenylate cyclase